MSTRKFILLLALAMAAVGIAAFALMAVKDRTYVASEAYAPVGEPNRAVAVVYYSRSGHSEAVAREVARTFNAPIARISADYPLDFSGQGKAVSDANAGELPRIEVGPIDLDPVRRLFLVSPTWMFRPATPLWAYVEQANLDGQGNRARHDRQQPVRANGDRCVRKAGRGTRWPTHSAPLPTPGSHLLAEEPGGSAG